MLGIALAGVSRRGRRRVRVGLVLLVRGQVDSLLVHALGLHSLDQTEKVLVWNRGGPRTQIGRGAALIVYPRGLALDEHVEEIVAGLLGVRVSTQVPEVVLGDPEARQVADVGPLVVQPAALGAGDEVKQLLRLW